MSRFAILLGGVVQRTPELDAQLAGARVVAADSGMRHARMLGLTPELWAGDFDSVSEALDRAFAAVPREIHPRDKDRTDGEIAIEAALARGATSLVLVGAFGGPRPDHAHLHLAQAIRLTRLGVTVLLTSGAQEGVPLIGGDERVFDYAEGTLFSILAFGDLAGLTVRGAKWPLDAVEVLFGSSLTLSNVVRGRLGVRLDKGQAMLVAHLTRDG